MHVNTCGGTNAYRSRDEEEISIPWTSSNPFRATLTSSAPNAYGATPSVTAVVSYFSPYKNKTVSESFVIGGEKPTQISVVTGSLVGLGMGEIRVEVSDNPELP